MRFLRLAGRRPYVFVVCMLFVWWSRPGILYGGVFPACSPAEERLLCAGACAELPAITKPEQQESQEVSAGNGCGGFAAVPAVDGFVRFLVAASPFPCTRAKILPARYIRAIMGLQTVK